MPRKKPRLDDLEEMRKDLDHLGIAMGLRPKGAAKPGILKPPVKAKAAPASAPPRSDPGPGKVR